LNTPGYAVLWAAIMVVFDDALIVALGNRGGLRHLYSEGHAARQHLSAG